MTPAHRYIRPHPQGFQVAIEQDGRFLRFGPFPTVAEATEAIDCIASIINHIGVDQP